MGARSRRILDGNTQRDPSGVARALGAVPAVALALGMFAPTLHAAEPEVQKHTTPEPVRVADPAKPPSDTVERASAAAGDSSGATQSAEETSRPLPLGLSLLGGGAAVLAASVTALTWSEQLTRPDDNRTPQRSPELNQAVGFAMLSAASASVGLMLVGAALVIDDTAPNGGKAETR